MLRGLTAACPPAAHCSPTIPDHPVSTGPGVATRERNDERHDSRRSSKLDTRLGAGYITERCLPFTPPPASQLLRHLHLAAYPGFLLLDCPCPVTTSICASAPRFCFPSAPGSPCSRRPWLYGAKWVTGRSNWPTRWQSQRSLACRLPHRGKRFPAQAPFHRLPALRRRRRDMTEWQ
jgi:hypothetical protein